LAPRAAPLAGYLPQFRRDRLGFLARVALEHGDMVELRLGRYPLHLASHPDLVREVLVTRQQAYRKGPILQSWAQGCRRVPDMPRHLEHGVAYGSAGVVRTSTSSGVTCDVLTPSCHCGRAGGRWACAMVADRPWIPPWDS
jgi:hypothetical protein